MSINSLSLYKIGEQYQDLLNKLYDHETGEIDSLVSADLDSLTPSFEQKCLSIGSYIKSLEAEKKEVEYLRQEIIRRDEAYNKKIDRMFDYLHTNMLKCGIKEIKSPYFKLKIKENPYSTEVYDQSQIPEEFVMTKIIQKIETKPDKNKIKDSFLQTGEQIPGTVVTRKTRLEILTDEI
jgi:hypothetical protein